VVLYWRRFAEKRRGSGDARALSYEGKRRGDDDASTRLLSVQWQHGAQEHVPVPKPVMVGALRVERSGTKRIGSSGPSGSWTNWAGSSGDERKQMGCDDGLGQNEGRRIMGYINWFWIFDSRIWFPKSKGLNIFKLNLNRNQTRINLNKLLKTFKYETFEK
jgi:hypothetical protein